MPEIICLTNSSQILRVGLPHNLPHYVLYQTVDRILETHYLQERKLSGLNRQYSLNTRGRPYINSSTPADRYNRSNRDVNSVQPVRRFSVNNAQIDPVSYVKNPVQRRITLPQTVNRSLDLGPNLPQRANRSLDLGPNLPHTANKSLDLGPNLPQRANRNLDLRPNLPLATKNSLDLGPSLPHPNVHRKLGFQPPVCAESKDPFDRSLTTDDRSVMGHRRRSMMERGRKYGMSQEVVIQEEVKEGRLNQRPYAYLIP
jgi:hypothetical protein